ncbi:endonuclease V [Microbulbifer sp. SSSA002]|uniref:endonuclease V n=1 Tax=Microbulbifer sp. SSSA002 TaxID=3243376 RepID=UPI00403A650D
MFTLLKPGRQGQYLIRRNPALDRHNKATRKRRLQRVQLEVPAENGADRSNKKEVAIMILAVDVDYREPGALVAGVAFEHWSDPEPQQQYRSHIDSTLEYEPGAFYKRELPCILTLIEEHQIKAQLIIIDGYVNLGKEQRPGLGAHLYSALRGEIPIIGVAKKPFKDTPAEAQLLRGNSIKPLYISSLGLPLTEAKQRVLKMHGKHRIPTLLKWVDRECRRTAL